jgi:hypothetical protein
MGHTHTFAMSCACAGQTGAAIETAAAAVAVAALVGERCCPTRAQTCTAALARALALDPQSIE